MYLLPIRRVDRHQACDISGNPAFLTEQCQVSKMALFCCKLQHRFQAELKLSRNDRLSMSPAVWLVFYKNLQIRFIRRSAEFCCLIRGGYSRRKTVCNLHGTQPIEVCEARTYKCAHRE
ncbi:hypothetical protein [Polaromonas sp.]|uniref:hypothetical protein n=1 Tax=Polaromonas sp. TaxID=1869339 RepID=UPI003BB7D23E